METPRLTPGEGSHSFEWSDASLELAKLQMGLLDWMKRADFPKNASTNRERQHLIDSFAPKLRTEVKSGGVFEKDTEVRISGPGAVLVREDSGGSTLILGENTTIVGRVLTVRVDVVPTKEAVMVEPDTEDLIDRLDEWQPSVVVILDRWAIIQRRDGSRQDEVMNGFAILPASYDMDLQTRQR